MPARLLFIIACLVSPALLRAQAVDFPSPPKGQVLDQGKWLGEDRTTRLEEELGRIRQAYQIDVLVVLWDRALKSGTSLEEVATSLGESWAREDFWIIVLHAPDSLHRPTVVFGGPASMRYPEELPGLALHTAVTRGMKERTTRAQVEALGLECGEEFVFLKNRHTLEHRTLVAQQDRQLQEQKDRDRSMIFRATIATVLALVAVGVVALLYILKRRPSDLHFPETRWRRRLGADWSGGGRIVVSLPPRIS